jgi:hypothetical protein
MLRYALLLFVVLVGCEPAKRVYPLPEPPPEYPVCNLPLELRQQNWSGRLGQGSCVYASLINHVRWLNLPDFASKIRATRGDGEYASRLMGWLDSEGVPYKFTEKADPRFLDWCTYERTGCILWWKPSHCCTFEGWVRDQNGNQYATILDNNYINKYEYIPREQFVRLWAGYGGFALAVVDDPAISIPFRSYEER